jgi:hypothetical protein
VLVSPNTWWSGCRRIARRREFIALLGSAAAIRPLGARGERPPAHILYFTYSAGYKHDVIPLSKAVLTQLGRNSGVFEVTVTEDVAEFSNENLERYAAVMFYTTGELPMSGAEVLVPVVHGFELAAIDIDARRREEAHLAAEFDEARTYLAKRQAVVFAEVCDCLVIRCELTQQPHDFDIAAFEPPARLSLG